jgi:hypothetical protein
VVDANPVGEPAGATDARRLPAGTCILVPLSARLAERPEILSQELAWRLSPAHPPLTIDLAVFFARVYRE